MTPAFAAPDGYAASYDLLARLFLRGPRALAPASLPPLPPLIQALTTINPNWPPLISCLCETAAHDRDGTLQAEFEACLVIPQPGRYTPPYASFYLEGTLWGESTRQAQRCYEQEGLQWTRIDPAAGSPTILAPDHLGIELAFLAVAESDNQLVSPEIDAERTLRLSQFLDQHLLQWLPKFVDAISEASTPCISSWAQWALQLAQSDQTRLAALTGQPQRPTHPRPVSYRKAETNMPAKNILQREAETG
jgi:TorA maturation chaperone TorD